MIILLFLIGFILGIGYCYIGQNLPLLLPEIDYPKDNSWILNLFIGVLNAVIVLISYYNYGLSYMFFTSLIIAALVIIIYISDIKYFIILDSPLIVSSVLVFILKWIYFDLKTALISILSGLLLFAFMFLIGLLGKKMFKKEALGGGDIKLSFTIGLILGFPLGLIALIISSFLAIPYAIAVILLNKDNIVPYGPFLISSLALIFLFQDKFMNFLNFLLF